MPITDDDICIARRFAKSKSLHLGTQLWKYLDSKYFPSGKNENLFEISNGDGSKYAALFEREGNISLITLGGMLQDENSRLLLDENSNLSCITRVAVLEDGYVISLLIKNIGGPNNASHFIDFSYKKDLSRDNYGSLDDFKHELEITLKGRRVKKINIDQIAR